MTREVYKSDDEPHLYGTSNEYGKPYGRSAYYKKCLVDYTLWQNIFEVTLYPDEYTPTSDEYRAAQAAIRAVHQKEYNHRKIGVDEKGNDKLRRLTEGEKAAFLEERMPFIHTAGIEEAKVPRVHHHDEIFEHYKQLLNSCQTAAEQNEILATLQVDHDN